MHHYRVTCAWRGSTAGGVEAYDRAHAASAPPAHVTLALSADPAFRGDPTLLNPEQLLVLAAASCQLLTFLSCAARARLDVVAYEDDAEGVMPDHERPMRITRIDLHPRITVCSAGDDPDRRAALVRRVGHLCDVAHRECFIANSLTAEIAIHPTVEIVDQSGATDH